MALEVATTILDLNDNWPLGTDPLAQGDDHIRLLKSVLQAAYPVGSVMYNTTGVNPGSYIGGTWEPYAPGRAIVGVGDNGEADWTNGQLRGFESITLTAGQIPEHTHDIAEVTVSTALAGTHAHNATATIAEASSLPLGRSPDPPVSFAINPVTEARQTTAVADHTHSVTIPATITGSTGSSGAHNNIQPSIGTYAWERTA